MIHLKYFKLGKARILLIGPMTCYMGKYGWSISIGKFSIGPENKQRGKK